MKTETEKEGAERQSPSNAGLDEKWCPTRAGSYRAYNPEYLGGDGVWRPVPTTETIGNGGAPYENMLLSGGISITIGLFGKAQAMALAWQYAAQAAAAGHDADVRVQEYEVVYDIKARKVSNVQIEGLRRFWHSPSRMQG